MQQRQGRDPKCIEQRLERRMEALPVVREHFGAKGIRAHVSEDHVMVLLPFELTEGEATLVSHGAPKAVLELRHEMQMVMKGELVDAVETEMGRDVEAFLSANHLHPHVGVETFLLAPAG